MVRHMKTAVSPAIDAESIIEEFDSITGRSAGGTREHQIVLLEVLDRLNRVDFWSIAEIDPGKNVPHRIQVVLTVQEVLRAAEELRCGLCLNQGFTYTFNGQFWQLLSKGDLERFLGDAAERVGVEWLLAQHYKFRKELVNQFYAAGYLPSPAADGQKVLINFQNGTGEFTPAGFRLRPFRREDFLTYQLPFEYDLAARCPKWLRFLSRVLPDESRQRVLAEYLGYIFARHLKLEITMILFGLGANGKSVVHDVTRALLGKENISSVSLESLCNSDYYRMMLANKLLNFSTEISDKINADRFKKLTSGEPIEARLPYGQPTELTNYARLAFNANQLPADVEFTEAYFRRFLIIPFDIIIPEVERNPRLAEEIIEAELSGVFNWVLDGLNRLLEQGRFSECKAAGKLLEAYKLESDSVASFLDECGYRPSLSEKIHLKVLYPLYRDYCIGGGHRPFSDIKMRKRMEQLGYETATDMFGRLIFAEK
jgi:putative DNA primase/helicase